MSTFLVIITMVEEQHTPLTSQNTTSSAKPSLDILTTKSGTPQVAENSIISFLGRQASSTAGGNIWVFSWSEIINGVIQVISVIATVVFGVWAVKSFDAAQQANFLIRTALEQTLIANQLALLLICASNQVSFFIKSHLR
jgi:hypothetical protein